ncbi:SNF2-related protein [Desulfocicer vacuolatum]|uniref:SNF2-related protein n=1 Tax=Desulfocicer vacuolatum TaxID=2298 RepID=UPI001E60A7DD
MVILQAAGDLQEFKLQGAGIEIRQNVDAPLPADNPDACENAHDKKDEENNGIRYALKVGNAFGSHRLDMDRCLVITTYQTLRDYQFSLCRIDWSFVIFDEAQHIKNPNTLATRAAKGLKAQFKLLATGTPVENHLGDFWCLMDTASPGTLGAYQSFRETYINPIRQAAGSEVFQVRLDVGRKLRKETGALMLRRLKEDNIEGLPSLPLLPPTM